MAEASEKPASALDSRRATPRIPGPFDGRRRGALTVDIRIHDLSAGGCLIESYHEVAPGRRMKLDIDLPYEGWITVEAESLYTRADYGFAVKFVQVSAETLPRLERAIERRRSNAGLPDDL